MTTERGADDRPLAVALMGPTASGKTDLALDWAERLDTEVISVDSALVYRGMDIGAAKPDKATRERIQHHLIDVREPDETYSAADFARDALDAMLALRRRGKIPLLVGGTGLYFHALLEGLSAMPAADPAVREQIHAEAAVDGWAHMHQALARVDAPAAGRIHRNDPQRITRALEVYRLSGKPISEWQTSSLPQRFPFRVLKVILAPSDRSVLHERIERRFDAMLDAGFLDEVRQLRCNPALTPDLPAMRAVGYRQAWRHLDAGSTAAVFRQEGVAATRQLAKRQLTWLRSQVDACWFDPLRDRCRLATALLLFTTRR